MKKIIPFKKDIIFKTNLSEITSISLEHTLKIEDNVVIGNFIVSGDYKVTDNSVDSLDFSYELPFEVAFDLKYKLDKAKIDIDDFYYEIINSNVLSVNIEVSIDNIEEVEEEIMDKVEENISEEVEEERCVEEEIEEVKEEPISLFDTINVEDSYNTYKVYIVRENDTLESILEKYNVTKETLEEYNDLSEIKIGNKIVIPVINERD